MTPVTFLQIRQWINRDPLLSKVRELVQHGWQESEEEQLKPFQQRKEELSVQDSCVLWGNRVIIPSVGRERVLQVLHDGHPGISKMKQLARSVVWWPRIDVDIEKTVKGCLQCERLQKAPAQAPLHPWEWPSRPWVRVHVDNAGPFLGKMFLVLIDSHSKWMEIQAVSSANTSNTIDVLRSIFSSHGLPEIIVA